MNKTEAFKTVLADLQKHPMFCGLYDAKNGKEDFMHGINTVMEYIAYSISDEVGDEMSSRFVNNMIWSEDKVR